MKSRFRFVIYLVLGMVIYIIIDSGGTSFTHEDARRALIFVILGVFALLVIATVIKRRHEK